LIDLGLAVVGCWWDGIVGGWKPPLRGKECCEDGPLGPSSVVSVDIGYSLSDLRINSWFLPLHAATFETGDALLDRRNRSAMIFVRKSWI